jgi:hypothetical protein
MACKHLELGTFPPPSYLGTVDLQIFLAAADTRIVSPEPTILPSIVYIRLRQCFRIDAVPHNRGSSTSI